MKKKYICICADCTAVRQAIHPTRAEALADLDKTIDELIDAEDELRAEAEMPKVELNPYTFSEACAIYEKLLGEKFELERKLRAALTEIADFKAMLGTDQIERLKARLQK